jgi:hypothetical protein
MASDSGSGQASGTFQERVRQWTLACFGQAIADDKVERNHRFLEESLELVQTLGCTRSEAHQLVDYVFSRPQGVPPQECGGVLVTLMALCNANGLTAELCGEIELERVYAKIEQIRAKQAAKPKHSPLPEPLSSAPAVDRAGVGIDFERWMVEWTSRHGSQQIFVLTCMKEAWIAAQSHSRAGVLEEAAINGCYCVCHSASSSRPQCVHCRPDRFETEADPYCGLTPRAVRNIRALAHQPAESADSFEGTASGVPKAENVGVHADISEAYQAGYQTAVKAVLALLGEGEK